MVSLFLFCVWVTTVQRLKVFFILLKEQEAEGGGGGGGGGERTRRTRRKVGKSDLVGNGPVSLGRSLILQQQIEVSLDDNRGRMGITKSVTARFQGFPKE